jgi:hypothetical protein
MPSALRAKHRQPPQPITADALRAGIIDKLQDHGKS